MTSKASSGTTTASSLVQKVAEKLAARGETLSLAESCTGGLLSAQLAAYAGISQVYLGSVVAYSNQVKEELLDVPAHLLKSLGAVSTPVAVKMAEGARAKIRSTLAVSITGIAGPSGGSARKPVGTVCFALAGPGFVECFQEHFDGSRTEVQMASAEYALKLILQHLN
jgi:PncC family amidohydrolase